MLRQRAPVLASLALVAVAALGGCGIKGPLTLPPKADPAKPASAPPGPAIPAIPDATTLPAGTRGNTAP